LNHKLRRSASQPPWQERLKELLLAGGVLGLVSCSTDSTTDRRLIRDGGGPDGVGCGNANPDPCICGRAEASAQAAAACAVKRACDRSGRAWTLASDGGVVCVAAEVPPQPTLTVPPPTANPPQLPPDGGSFGCGNANPDPCICDRPKASPEAAKACAAEMACIAHGGRWTLVGDPTGVVRQTCIGYDASVPEDASLEGKP
jgi:hypothetical protein